VHEKDQPHQAVLVQIKGRRKALEYRGKKKKLHRPRRGKKGKSRGGGDFTYSVKRKWRGPPFFIIKRGGREADTSPLQPAIACDEKRKTSSGAGELPQLCRKSNGKRRGSVAREVTRNANKGTDLKKGKAAEKYRKKRRMKTTAKVD